MNKEEIILKLESYFSVRDNLNTLNNKMICASNAAQSKLIPTYFETERMEIFTVEEFKNYISKFWSPRVLKPFQERRLHNGVEERFYDFYLNHEAYAFDSIIQVRNLLFGF